jgi:electron transfer flavoprotein beta subunit
MHVLVCVKHVPDTTEVRFDRSSGELLVRGAPTKISDYDRHAVEEGAHLRERLGATVTLLGVGPPEAARTLKEALAMGADSATLVAGRWAASIDPAATARILAAAAERAAPYDLILCGDVSEDGYHGLVPGLLAEALAVPHIGAATGLEIEDGHATVTRLTEDAVEKYRIQLPAVVSVSRTINSPRLATTLQVMKVPMSRITTVSVGELGIDEADLAPERLATRVIGMRPAGVARRNRILEGEPDEVVRELISSLEEMGVLS